VAKEAKGQQNASFSLFSLFLFIFSFLPLSLFRFCGGNNDDGAISRCKAVTLRANFSLDELDAVTKLLDELVGKFAMRDVDSTDSS